MKHATNTFIIATGLLLLLIHPGRTQTVADPGHSNVEEKAISGADSSQSQAGSGNILQVKKEWRISFAKIFFSILVFLIAFLVIKYLTKFFEVLGERWVMFRLLVKRLVPIIRISGWTVVIYFIIAFILSPPIETLIAVTASAGIAIGFASQDILKNIFGGIMILFDRPFQVGDKIQVGDHYGEVIQIGLRTVRLVTAEDSVVSVPNSEIVNQSVSNANTGEFSCQVVSEFYLPADIDIPRLKKICFLAAAVSRYAYLKKPVAVVMRNEMLQGRSILKVKLKAYVFDLRYEFAFASEMTELVMRQILLEGLVSADTLSYFNTVKSTPD